LTKQGEHKFDGSPESDTEKVWKKNLSTKPRNSMSPYTN